VTFGFHLPFAVCCLAHLWCGSTLSLTVTVVCPCSSSCGLLVAHCISHLAHSLAYCFSPCRLPLAARTGQVTRETQQRAGCCVSKYPLSPFRCVFVALRASLSTDEQMMFLVSSVVHSIQSADALTHSRSHPHSLHSLHSALSTQHSRHGSSVVVRGV